MAAVERVGRRCADVLVLSRLMEEAQPIRCDPDLSRRVFGWEVAAARLTHRLRFCAAGRKR